MSWDPFGELRVNSQNPDWLAKQQAAWTKLGITPGAGTQLFKPTPRAGIAPPPAVPGVPGIRPPAPPTLSGDTVTGTVMPGAGQSNPSAFGQPPAKLFGQQFGNYPGTGTGAPSIFPPGLGGNTQSGTDADYPFPRYLAMMGLGNNLM